MNHLTMSLATVGIQVSVVALLGVLCYPLATRRGPVAAAWTLTASLGLILVLTLVAFCPLPSWWNWTPKKNAAQSSAPEPSTAPADSPVSTAAREQNDASVQPASEGGGDGLALPLGLLGKLWHGMESRANAAPDRVVWWPTGVVAVFLAGAFLSLARVFAGLWAVQSCRRRSRGIDDAALQSLVDSLRLEMGCRRRVEIRESPELATAATVGWLRPVLFLPTNWRLWTEVELRVVVAHELAHVRRRDYVAGLLACLSVALHFYHPLVYWLAGRMRLQQELAADALAARFAGGKSLYLRVLAEMALRQSGRPVGWPARTFLPAPGTLLRRVRMLRAKDGFAERSFSRTSRILLTAALVCAAVAMSAVRSPAQKAGEDGPKENGKTEGQEYAIPVHADDQIYPLSFVDSGTVEALEAPALDLSYLPPDAMGAWGIRPAALFGQPELKESTEKLNKWVSLVSKMELKLPAHMILPIEGFEQITGTVVFTTDKNRKENQSTLALGVTMIRSVKDFDWARQFKIIFPKTEEVKYEGKVYYKVPRGEVAALLGSFFGSELYYYVPDARTVVINSEEYLRRIIHDGKPSQPKFPWSEDWKSVEHGVAALAISNRDLSWLTDRTIEDNNWPEKALALLVGNTKSVTCGFDCRKHFLFQVICRAEKEESARKAEQGIKDALNAARKELKEYGEMQPPKSPEGVKYDFGKELLDRSKVTREGMEVRWRSEPKGTLAELRPLLIPEEMLKE